MSDREAVLHRIEALPGQGRYALSFRLPDGSEQTATATVASTEGVDIAEAALPTGWRRDSELSTAMAAAVSAFDAARRTTAPSISLADVDGGWDVSLGNVVLDEAGRPSCTAHGPMTEDAGVYTCADCGARATFS